jgi:DNA-binding GntR family transcriptional regulator
MYDGLTFEHSSTVERAADEIRRAVLDGRLGPGTPLREVALSEAMGVGRSTIREALAVLVGDGLAIRVAHKGVAVKALSSADVADVSLARLAVEIAGVRRWHEATDAERAAVREALEDYEALATSTTEAGALTEAHLRIHRSFVGLTGSVRLVAAADAYSAELRLGLAHLDRVRDNLDEMLRSHRLLLDLLEAGDVEAAATQLADHLGSAEDSLREQASHDTIDS